MLKVLSVMLIGLLVGVLLLKATKRWNISNAKVSNIIGGFLKLTIWLLLFVLGVQVGSNDIIMSHLHTLGLEALLIGMLATLGSCTGAWLLWKFATKRGGKE